MRSIREIHRRELLTLGSAALLCVGTDAAASTTTSFLLASSAPFLSASERLTGFASLSADLAERIWTQLSAHAVATEQFAQLVQITLRSTGNAALSSGLAEAGLAATRDRVLLAWYTGSLGAEPDAPVVAYAEALMYAAVADGLPAPTYALGGPGWWTAPPPAAGVAPPMAPPIVESTSPAPRAL